MKNFVISFYWVNFEFVIRLFKKYIVSLFYFRGCLITNKDMLPLCVFYSKVTIAWSKTLSCRNAEETLEKTSNARPHCRDFVNADRR